MTIIAGMAKPHVLKEAICPGCGSVGTIRTDKYKRSDAKSKGIPVFVHVVTCKACGIQWIENNKEYSSSQLIAFMFMSISALLSDLSYDYLCSYTMVPSINDTDDKDDYILHIKRKAALLSFLKKLMDYAPGSSGGDLQCILDRIERENDMDGDDIQMFYSVFNDTVQKITLKDIVSLYNTYIKIINTQGLTAQYASECYCMLGSGYYPCIDSVEHVMSDC